MLNLLFASALLAANPLITPTELREQLAAPAAQSFQQQLAAVRAAGQYHGELDPVLTDPQLAPAARDWLLHQTALALREQAASTAGQHLLRQLSGYQSPWQWPQDVEGRQRPVPLAPVAQAAQATLRWWQQQADAAQLAPQLNSERIHAAARRWSSMSEPERSSWLLAVQRPAADLPARLSGLASETLADQAPALAAALAIPLHDMALAAAVLRRNSGSEAVQLLGALPAHFTHTEQRALLAIALGNPSLRSAGWYALAKHRDPDSQQQLQRAAAAGERAAVAAWVQEQGEQALPGLDALLQQKTETAQLNAIYGLRLLATPAAQQRLQQAAQHTGLSARAKQELQP